MPPRAPNATRLRSPHAASPAGRHPSNPPSPFHQPGSGAASRPLSPGGTTSAPFDTTGSPHSGGAHFSESDTFSDFIPALNPPSPHNYTPRGMPWRPLSRSGSIHDPASPNNNSARASGDCDDTESQHAQHAPQSALARAAAVVGAVHVGRDEVRSRVPLQPRHRFDVSQAAASRHTSPATSPESSSRGTSGRTAAWPPVQPRRDDEGESSLL